MADDIDDVVARVLLDLRDAGLLPTAPPAPALPEPLPPRPRRQRKRIGAGPRAYRPSFRGKPAPRGQRVHWAPRPGQRVRAGPSRR